MSPVTHITDGFTPHYRTDGDPGGAAVVLINSLGTSLDMWSPQREALASHYFVVSYDARGHGRSEVPTGPYAVAQMGNDLLSLMDKLQLQRAHLCGLSLGGMVGQWMGVHAPDRVDRLILCNTAAKIGSADGWNARIHKVQSEGMQSIVSSVIERWFTSSFRSNAPTQVEEVAAMLRSTSAAGYAASCAAIRDMDQRAEVAHISAPTLIIAGTHDQVTTPEDSDALRRAIPASQLVELNAAHLSNIEAADAFTDAVISFLKKGGNHG